MKIFSTLLVLLYLIGNHLNSQNTVGIISNTTDSFEGYTLFTAQTETYLIDNCGRVINQWSSSFPPGNAVYLLENGNLLRAAKVENPDIDFGGAGGRIELFNWDGNLVWEFEYNTDQYRQHHDIYPMPNGNILMLAVSIMSNTEAIQAGRNPANLSQSVLYNEQILELEPVGVNSANIIWQWNIKDHLIQEFDGSKNNYAVIADNPQLLDINFLGQSQGNSNWMHVNSIQYYNEFDQIVLSSRLLNEIYIIDHSTTTAEAASHTGGNYGKGGDLLYRWGNPQAYNQGNAFDKKLFGQHFPHFIPNGLLDAGKIILFNNGFNRDPNFSEVFILDPPMDSPGFYSYAPDTAYGPIIPDFTYVNPTNPEDFYSAILSGAQKLPNGNILVCEGTSGRFFEINSSGTNVWEYISPITPSKIVNQGETPTGNTVFRALKYHTSYSAFNGKDLTPGNTIETGTDITACNALSLSTINKLDVKTYPNPTIRFLNLSSKKPISKIEFYDLFGKLIYKIEKENIKYINIESLESGIYLLKISSNNYSNVKRIVKKSL